MKKVITMAIAVILLLISLAVIKYKFDVKSDKYKLSNKEIQLLNGESAYKALEKLDIKNTLFVKLYIKFNKDKIFIENHFNILENNLRWFVNINDDFCKNHDKNNINL